MSDQPKEWTLEGFVEHFSFVHDTMGDHKYCWVLGAGASKASGIPLGSELVDRWLDELYVRECADKEKFKDVETWATPENLGKDVFRQFKWGERASFYPQIFQRRFRQYPKEGYAYLENVMSGKDPSPGYSILAAALAGQVARPNHAAPHNVVITTNFDNLPGDALSIYTDTFPLICGHESLAGFAGVSLNRPLICKIHRDLLFAPQNDPRSLKRLKDAWGIALTALFEHYTPLFIGYGGNDDTLMDLLESLEPGSIKGQLVWTYYYDEKRKQEDQRPNERIRSVVADHGGVLVPIPDFDRVMILLGEKMKIGLLDQEITRRSNRRVEQYRNRVKALDILTYPAVTNAFAAMARRSEGWWAWEQVAQAEKDPDRKDMIYREALKHFPLSAELNGNFANFLWSVREQHDEAEALYKKALELNRNGANHTGNYAIFLWKIRTRHDEAEALYKKTLELDPNDANHTGNYADFLWRVREQHDEAEALFKKALELDPNHASHTCNYANFLTDVRGRHDEAERLYKKALELDPNDAQLSGNYANFLTDVRGQHDEAETLYKTALELDPNNANNTGNYANFLTNVRGQHGEAESLYKKALELDPNNADHTGNYAGFLVARGELDEATEKLLRAKALNGDKVNQLAGELALYEGISLSAKGEDDTAAIKQLGEYFKASLDRKPWPFDHVLAFAKEKMLPEDHYLYRALADGILDESKVPDVEKLLAGRKKPDQKTAKIKKAGKKRSPAKQKQSS